MKKGFTWLYPLTPTHLRGNSGHGSGSVTQSDDKAMSPMTVIGDVNITAAAGGAAVSAMTHLSLAVFCVQTPCNNGRAFHTSCCRHSTAHAPPLGHFRSCALMRCIRPLRSDAHAHRQLIVSACAGGRLMIWTVRLYGGQFITRGVTLRHSALKSIGGKHYTLISIVTIFIGRHTILLLTFVCLPFRTRHSICSVL